jgi:hypothetical protein
MGGTADTGGTGGTSDAGGAGGSGGTADSSVGACTPGDTRVCVGPGACAGGQACLPGGAAWSACDCGSGAGGTFGTGGVGGSAGASGGTGGGDACAAVSQSVEPVPLDLFIMMDKSGSMSGQNGQNGGINVWIPVQAAIKQFVESPQNTGVGVALGYFPIQAASCQMNDPDVCDCSTIADACSACRLVDYATFDVPVGLLPRAATAIARSLDAHGPSGATPTRPALEGALGYARLYSNTAPSAGRRSIVVLATDGRPNDCGSNVTNVAAVARTAFEANPSIATFVIGIGNTGNLNEIASAGGTNQAFVVDPASAGQDLLDALQAIRRLASVCTFNAPDPVSGPPLDPNLVNVRFTPQGGRGQLLFKVENAAACDPDTGGWHYESGANPTRIVLCGATCSDVEAFPGRLDFELGCPSVVGPVNRSSGFDGRTAL